MSALRKNVASQYLYFALINATTGAALTGATVTGKRSIDGAAQGNVTGTISEEAGGQYKIALSQADTNGNAVGYLFTATSAIPVHLHCYTTAADPSDAVRMGLTALPNAAAEAAGGLYTRGTGAGQINQPANGMIDGNVVRYGGTAGTFASGRPEVNTTHAAGTAWGAGAITAASIAADAITAAKVADGTIDAATFAAGAINAAAIAADAITDAKVASDVTIASVTGAVGSVTGAVGSVTGAVGSVTGAVGSVTGNVGGNVTGSVGSVATGGIAAASFAAGAIDAAAIATDAFGALELAAGAASEIATAVRTELATELGRVDVAVSTRLASAGYTAPLDAAGTRTAVGLASANLDTQLSTIDDFLDTEVAAIKAKTDLLPAVAAGAANGLVINGTNTGPLSISGGVTFSNSGGDAFTCSSSGSNGSGLAASGNGTGAGLKATGGATGDGGRFTGGATAGHGLKGLASSASGAGIEVTGGLCGLHAVGTAGSGLICDTSVSNSDGAQFNGVGTNGNGITATGGAGTGTGGHGLKLIGGVASGGGSAGHGVLATGGAAATGAGNAAGAGVKVVGGAGAASTNGAGPGVSTIGGGTTTVTGGAGLVSTGTGNLDGVQAVGAGSGNGAKITAGATGDAINLSAAAGDGIDAATNISGGVGIRAGITGDLTGNVSGSVGSVTGNVGGNVTGSVGSVASGGITAASIAADAITAAKIADGAIDAATFAAGAIDAAAIATDALGALELAAGAASEIATAVRTELATELGRVDVAVSTRLASASYTTPPTVGAIADQVWEEAIADHSGTVGSTAAALSAAGAAGDPWATAVPGAYGAGSAGKILGDNLNATVSSRATQTSVDTIDDFVDTEVAAIKAKTDNLPASPAATGDAMTLTAGERTSIGTAVWASATRTLTSFGTLVADIWAAVTDSAGVTTLLSRLTGTRAGLLDNLDATVSSRLATAGYTAPLSAAGTRTAVGLASANLDTQLDALPTNAELATALGTADDAVLAQVALVKAVTDKLDDTVEDDGGTFRFTANALEEAPTGGAAPTASAIADEVQTRTIAAVTSVIGVATGGITAGSIAADAIGASELAADAASEIASAVRTNLTTELGRIDVAVSSRASQTSVDDLPTNAELATSQAAADDATLAAIAALNNLSAAGVRTAVGLASANLDTQLDALPTNAELATALGTADDAMLAAIAALNNLSAAQVTAAVPTAAQNAAGLLDLTAGIETGLTVRQALRLIAAATAGKLSGAATATVTIRNAVADDKDRIIATVSADGNRSAITYDVA